LNIFFDCDYTILSYDQLLRRGTHDVFGRLVEDGHRVFLWSGEGARWSVVRRHGLEPYLSGVFGKPLQDFEAGLRRLEVSPVPDFVIDDYPGIVQYFGGYYIPEFYFARDDDDDELESVYQVVTEFAATGRASHKRWSPRTATGPPATEEVEASDP
jgi:hypothetical protein